jgi:hypothetical protein
MILLYWFTIPPLYFLSGTGVFLTSSFSEPSFAIFFLLNQGIGKRIVADPENFVCGNIFMFFLSAHNRSDSDPDQDPTKKVRIRSKAG